MRNEITCLGISILMAGCSSMPPFDAPTDSLGGPTVSTIIDKIQCEIAEARTEADNQAVKIKGIGPFDQWTAAVILTLTVNDTAGTGQSGLPLSYIDPLKATATSFAFNASPILYQTRARTYAQTYTIDIANIPPGQTCANMNISPHGFNLEGNLGLKAQIYMGLHAFGREQQGADVYQVSTTAGKLGDNFGATVSFHIFKGVSNVGPTWTLQTFKGPTAGVGYQRDDLHQIVITFAPTASKIPLKAVPPQPNEPQKPKEQGGGESKSLEAQSQYNKALADYNRNMVDYQRSVATRNAIIASNAVAARANAARSASAADTARNANQNLLTYQAIQNLGQILSRP